MPLLKGVASKALVHEVISYITNPKKAAIVEVRNLFVDEDYAKQFIQTMNRFNKGKKYNERKYYHFKLSCAREDNVSVEEAQIFADELTARLFTDYECVIATHIDTKTIHSHIVVNAIHPITGKKLHISSREYTAMKDLTNTLGVEMGFSYTNFRAKARNKRTTEEKQIILKGGISWKEELREVIQEAKQIANSEEEFISHLKLYGVKITRHNKEYTYLHPKKEKGIRGNRLGLNYCKEEIKNVINENRYRRSCEAIRRTFSQSKTRSGGDINNITKRSISDIQRELQGINRETEYSSKGLDNKDRRIKGGESEKGNSSRESDRVRKGEDERINRARKNIQVSYKPKCKSDNNFLCK